MSQISLSDLHNVYFVGIGGVSMSSLALILKKRGISVAGYDLYHSENTALLEREGIQVDYEHTLSRLEKVDTVVFTAAVNDKTAPELPFARGHNIRLLSRAELLGAVTASYRYSVGIAGTHGKSTTTGMLCHIFLAYDSESSVIGGCHIPLIDSSYKIGSGDRVVFEACEYKDSFLSMHPSLKVILNCKLDHVDYFKDIDQIKKSFRTFAETPRSDTEGDNLVLADRDCENTMDALRGIKNPLYTYSVRTDADFCAKNITFEHGNGTFDLYRDGACVLPAIKLSVPGLHNVSDATAAAAAALLTGVPAEYVRKGLESFCGVSRRFEKKGTYGGALLVDDYAHHPDEITVTLSAAKALGKSRILCVFQPHTYSRTKALLPDFAKALSLADRVYLAPIYAAREVDTGEVSSEMLAERIPNAKAKAYDSFDSIAEVLENEIRPDDLVLSMGAGEAYKTLDLLLQKQK